MKHIGVIATILFFGLISSGEASEADSENLKPSLLVVEPFVSNQLPEGALNETLTNLSQSFNDFEQLEILSANDAVDAAFLSNPNIDFLSPELKKTLTDQGTVFLVLTTIENLGDDIVFVRSQVLDIRTSRVITSSFKSASTKIGFAGEIRFFTDDLVQSMKDLDVETILKSPDPHVPSPVAFVKLKSPQEGLEVSLPDGEPVGTITSGTFLYFAPPVVNGGLLYLKLSKPGFVTVTRAFTVINKDVPVDLGELNLVSKEHYKIMWHINYVTSAGFLYQSFLEPDWQYWEVGANLTVKSLEVYSISTKNKITHLRFLPEILVGFGSYVLSPPENLFRLSLGTRAGMLFNISTAKDAYLGTDLFLQPLVIGLELNFPYFTVSADVSYKFYLGVFETSLFQMGFQDSSPRLDLTFSLKGGGQ